MPTGTPIEIRQVETPGDIAAAREILAEYMAWTREVEGKAHDAPIFQGHAAELAHLPGVYLPPAGRFLLARDGALVAGCAALKPRGDKLCELKRVYVRPAFRGRKLGEALVRRAIDDARTIGYERVLLDSHVSMRAAQAIYLAAGFRCVDAPADFPDQFRPYVVFMELELA